MERLKENLIIFDVRGIQKYIFRSKKIKEISGASYIVENLLKDTIKKYLNSENITFKNWCDIENDKIFEFEFFKEENLNKPYVEIVYEGGGNLLLSTRLRDDVMKDFLKHIQLSFLKNSYSLSVAYATLEIDKNTDYINLAYPEIKRRLNEVKKRMPQLSLAKALPIVEIDDTNGYAKGYKVSKYNAEHCSYESKLKLDNYENYVSKKNKDLDSFYEIDEIDDSASKTLLAVVHIDGNDMGGIISSYMSMKKKNNMSFNDGVRISRELSYKINKVFKYNVKDIIDKYPARIVINSGDDITFVSKAGCTINLTKEIIEMIESNYLGDNPNNIFTSCAGIAFIHRHFPFHRAYETAEESCSIAKKRAKEIDNKYTITIDGKEIQRPASYIDFEIIKAGIIKDLMSKRSENASLYLRPYLVKVEHNNNIKLGKENPSIATLIDNVKYLSGENVSRNAVKEIRNTYESSEIETKILFKRLKSRKNLGTQEEYYVPYINGIAKLYDASTLIDILEKDGEVNE